MFIRKLIQWRIGYPIMIYPGIYLISIDYLVSLMTFIWILQTKSFYLDVVRIRMDGTQKKVAIDSLENARVQQVKWKELKLDSGTKRVEKLVLNSVIIQFGHCFCVEQKGRIWIRWSWKFHGRKYSVIF